jgi:urocanate hydratase
LSTDQDRFRKEITEGIPDTLPEYLPPDPALSHAPVRQIQLSVQERMLALRNALRYFPAHQHNILAPEFLDELDRFGRIYMYRYKPSSPIKARPIEDYPAEIPEAAAMMLMIQNNLDPAVAQHPEELITYGGNGAVFQNWAQYRLTMQYLSRMRINQTLVMYSGHPLGLFPAPENAPRVVITNGMMIPNYSKPEHWNKFNALGVTQYGQMTAGSWMYIGPQGIVHGTTITLLEAGRKKTFRKNETPLFVSSGLGGMSGAQPKAAKIAGMVALIAEMNPLAANKRKEQGWLDEVTTDADEAIRKALEAKNQSRPFSIAYLGNVVEIWEKLADTGIVPDIGSDQTSLHNPLSGGYYPVGYSLEESLQLMQHDPERFRNALQESLRRQVKAIQDLAKKGMYFFDYGNAFLLEASRAGAEVGVPGNFKFPTYIQDILGPLYFDYGFGPFRWICCSGDPDDLALTDRLATAEMERLYTEAPDEVRSQFADNLHWIKHAGDYQLVVGSQARIMYADSMARICIGEAFNKAIASGILKGPVVLGRDHHDVSGTDAPWRETSNIEDGSQFTADMSVQNFVGNAFRGATWVSLHNGGGTGWGEAINGGFGLMLDGSEKCSIQLQQMLFWDVNNGIARRAWARNPSALNAACRAMQHEPSLRISMPHQVDESLLNQLICGKST